MATKASRIEYAAARKFVRHARTAREAGWGEGAVKGLLEMARACRENARKHRGGES